MNIPAARLVFSPEDRAEILGLIDESLQTGSLTLGARTRELEASFAARHQSPHAVAVSSGTSALEITLRVLGVAGREVVVPANTFFATAAAVLHAGATPRFADIAESTLALTAETVEAALTPQTAGVIIVHVGGIVSPDVVAIRELCDRRGLFLMEDAAHAHGCFARRTIGRDLRGRRYFFLLPDEGDHRRGRGHDRHCRRPSLRGGGRLP